MNSSSPEPAGIVLTGGIPLSPAIETLIQDSGHLPIMATPDDTYAAAAKAFAVRAEIGVHSPKKIDAAR